MNKSFFIVITLVELQLAQGAFATNNTLLQTQSKLKTLEHEITQITTSLKGNETQRIGYQKTLTQLEKKIVASQSKLNQLQHELDASKLIIKTLENKQSQLNERLLTEQTHLANYLRARYKLNKTDPLMHVFNASHANDMQKKLVFYHYLVKNKHQLIHNLTITHHEQDRNRLQLQEEYNNKEQVIKRLQEAQKKIEQDKQQRVQLIAQLNQDSQQKKQSLTHCLANKTNLSRLLQQLAANSLLQTKHSLSSMRSKLPLPLTVNKKDISVINQGLFFFSAENAPVKAIYPGKIVFSHWLNGYGMLIIIDHGWGYMSLYGNNSVLIKHKGDIVNQGELIANAGHSGEFKKNGLYFELRYRGKVLSALNWLS